MATKKGKFIVIDGTDGSGKATQTALLLARLKKEGRRARKIDFPQYEDNFFGKLLHECLKGGKHGDFIALSPKIASVIYAADRFESSAVIRKLLQEGVTIVADRYVSANQIHQGGKIRNAKERKEFLKWLDHMEYGVFGIPRPDIIVYLHVPHEISLALIKKRAEEQGTPPDLAESNAKHLLESQEAALGVVKSDNSWQKIDCAKAGTMRPPEEISEKIFDLLRKRKVV